MSIASIGPSRTDGEVHRKEAKSAKKFEVQFLRALSGEIFSDAIRGCSYNPAMPKTGNFTAKNAKSAKKFEVQFLRALRDLCGEIISSAALR